MKISRTGEDLSVMLNYVHIPPRRRVRHMRNARSMQALPSLMDLLGKERHKYPPIPTSTNTIRI